MSAIFLEHADLRALNTLRLPARARWVVSIGSDAELREALDFAREHGLRTRVLGGGSNVVLRGEYDGLVLRMCTRGVEVLENSAVRTVIRVAAGEPWHEFVLACHRQGWHGLENLALIPGTVGAAPIQNIGAYGVEVAGFIREVTTVDIRSGATAVLSGDQCAFSYRDSVFKQGLAGRSVITRVTFDLPRGTSPRTGYAALAAELADPAHADWAEVLAAVIALRQRRLPDPAVLPNVGSFFRNPVLDARAFDALKRRAPDVVHWVQPDGSVKLAAAWLVDRCGWKGRREGDAGVHAAQALVLVNHGDASAQQILDLAGRIAESVEDRFGVRIELEPEVC